METGENYSKSQKVEDTDVYHVYCRNRQLEKQGYCENLPATEAIVNDTHYPETK